MKFIYRGVFSNGSTTQEAMGVLFVGREPSDVREDPSIRWMQGHPDYEQQPEAAEATEDAPKLPKKPRKAK